MTYEVLMRGGGRVAVDANLTPLQLENQLKEWQGTTHYVKFLSDEDTVTLVDPNEIVGFSYHEQRAAAVLGGAS